MTAIEIGRICVKTAGRTAGKFCIVTKLIDDNFVEITGPKELTGIKKNKCNIKHLEATENTIKINDNADDKTIIDAISGAKLDKVMTEGIKF